MNDTTDPQIPAPEDGQQSCAGEPESSILNHPLFEVGVIAFILFLAGSLNLFTPNDSALHLRPVPDAAEHAWIASAFANDHSFAFPIANEIHPSRFSVVHGYFASWPVWLTGGDLQNLNVWSQIGLLSGLLIFYLWMVSRKFSVPVRLLALILLLGNKMTFDIARDILQEPTLFLFLAISFGSFVIFQELFRKHTLNPDRKFFALASIAALISGIACGVMSGIRLTPSPIIFLYLAGIILPLLICQRSERFRNAKLIGTSAILFLAGFTAVLVLAAIGQHSNSGVFHLVGYHHWVTDPEKNLFRWSNPFQPPANLSSGEDMPWYIFNRLMGKSYDLHPLGEVYGYVFLGGFLTTLVVSFVSILKSIREKVSVPFLHVELFILCLFTLGQFIIHCYYFFFTLRFFILIYPGFVLAGLWGLQWLVMAGIEKRPTTGFRVQMISAVILVLVGMILNASKRIPIYQQQQDRDQVRAEKYLEFFEGLDEIREKVQTLEGPVFIAAGPGLNARLHLGLQEYPWPLLQIIKSERLYDDGHIPQFQAENIGERLDVLNSDVEYPSPEDCWLFRWGSEDDEQYDPDDETTFLILREEYFEGLRDHYSQISFLYFDGLEPYMQDVRQKLYEDIPVQFRQDDFQNRFRLVTVERQDIFLGIVESEE